MFMNICKLYFKLKCFFPKYKFKVYTVYTIMPYIPQANCTPFLWRNSFSQFRVLFFLVDFQLAQHNVKCIFFMLKYS